MMSNPSSNAIVSSSSNARPTSGKGSGLGSQSKKNWLKSKLKALQDAERELVGNDAMKFILPLCKALYQAENPDEDYDWGDDLDGLLVESLASSRDRPFRIQIKNLQVLLADLDWTLSELYSKLAPYGFVVHNESSGYYLSSKCMAVKEALMKGSFTLIVSHHSILTEEDINLSVAEEMRASKTRPHKDSVHRQESPKLCVRYDGKEHSTITSAVGDNSYLGREIQVKVCEFADGGYKPMSFTVRDKSGTHTVVLELVDKYHFDPQGRSQRSIENKKRAAAKAKSAETEQDEPDSEDDEKPKAKPSSAKSAKSGVSSKTKSKVKPDSSKTNSTAKAKTADKENNKQSSKLSRKLTSADLYLSDESDLDDYEPPLHAKRRGTLKYGYNVDDACDDDGFCASDPKPKTDQKKKKRKRKSAYDDDDDEYKP